MPMRLVLAQEQVLVRALLLASALDQRKALRTC